MSNAVTPIPERVKKLEDLDLLSGGHSAPASADDGPPPACFNEAITWLVEPEITDETWTDQHRCVSPIVRTVGMRLNDRLGHADRQRLKAFILPAIGTADDGQEEARRWISAEWAFRYALPKWLDACGLTERAEQLRALPELTSAEVYEKAGVSKLVSEIRAETWQLRLDRRAKIREAVEAVLKKRGIEKGSADAVAVAAAAAAADAAAAAAADAAAAAVADAVAAAAAAADAAAAAAAAAVAVAAAAAAADAAAAAAAVAVAAAAGIELYSTEYYELRQKIREKLKPLYEEKLGTVRDEVLEDCLKLLGRLIDPSKAA